MLGFPVDWQTDKIVWNAHRIYGPLRLALATGELPAQNNDVNRC